jgi:stage V sporulation protein SpoVS
MSGADRPPHAVLVRSPQAFSPTAVAAVLARRAGAPALDFVASARRGWGVAAESLPAAEAEALAAALTAAGQAALAAPASLLEEPVEAETVAKAEFSGDGFDLVAGPEHLAPERLSWSRLAAVCAAGLTTTTKKTVSEGGDMAGKAVRLGLTMATGIPIPLGGGEKKRVIESRDRALLLDLLFVEPARVLRVEGERFDYSLLGDRMVYSAEVNFSLLLAELASRAPRALRGKGSRAMLAKRPAAESLYESLEDLKREQRWLLSLAALKAALP